MTVCVGLRDQDAVYLIADSAVTTNPAGLTTPRSTFGELHYSDRGRSVKESALKVFRHGSTAATFCGNADVARDIFRTYISASSHGDPCEAFRSAWRSHGPFFGVRKVEALLAYWDGAPQLFHFENEAKLDGEPVDIKILGSFSTESSNALSDIFSSFPAHIDTSESRLNCMLSYFQSHSVFENFMEAGVGGFYIGAYIDNSGLSWAGPHWYLILRNDLESVPSTGDSPSGVLVSVKEDIVFVWSEMWGGWFAFANSFGSNQGLTPTMLVDKAKRLTRDMDPQDVPLKYLTFYNLKTYATTVFRVNGCDPGPHIHPRWEMNEGKSRLLFSCSKLTMETLVRETHDGGYLAFLDCSDVPLHS
jgi:hypothetical protein